MLSFAVRARRLGGRLALPFARARADAGADARARGRGRFTAARIVGAVELAGTLVAAAACAATVRRTTERRRAHRAAAAATAARVDEAAARRADGAWAGADAAALEEAVARAVAEVRLSTVHTRTLALALLRESGVEGFSSRAHVPVQQKGDSREEGRAATPARAGFF